MKTKLTSIVSVIALLIVLPANVLCLSTGTIVRESFTVGAGGVRAWSFAVHPRGGHVYGKFRAEGGSGNDIECLILSEEAYENFINGHAVPTFYNSGKITVATINVNLAEGRYFIVFSNRFSAMTPKAVNAGVFIELPTNSKS